MKVLAKYKANYMITKKREYESSVHVYNIHIEGKLALSLFVSI